jgi:hypothetical protein
MARDDDDNPLGGGFWKWMAGIGLLGVVGVVLIFLLIHGAWTRWGALGSLIFFFLVLMAVAWFYDRRQVKNYAEEL